MRKSNSLIVIIVAVIFLSLFTKNSVFALEIDYPPVPGAEPPQIFMEKIKNGDPGYEPEKALPLFVKYLYNLALTACGIVVLGVIAYGGFLYLISAGNVGRAKEGRDYISSGFLGLIILLSSFVILQTINPELLILKLPHVSPPQTADNHRECRDGLCVLVGGVGSDTCASSQECPKGQSKYVEIPFGILIESVKVKAEIAKGRAEQVYNIGAETNQGDGAASVEELSRCLARLASQCTCGMPTENCSESGGGCSTGTCTAPCDKEIAKDLCSDLDVPNLCPTGSITACPGATGPGVPVPPSQAQPRGSGCDLTSVITAKTSELNALNNRLLVERNNAIVATQTLDIENQKLKLAEILMRASIVAPISYHFFAGLENAIPEKIDAWANLNLSKPTSIMPQVIPPASCSLDKPYEIIPACVQCQDILFCYGNDYRACCADPAIEALRSEGMGKNRWFSPATFNPSSSVSYNSVNYTVPQGGVFVCGNNVFGCVNWRCKATSDKIFSDDPATFYVPEEGNEDLIAMVKSATFESILPPVGPPIDPTWTPNPNPSLPPGYMPPPGTINDRKDCAILAREATGVRASLIIALFNWESGWQQFPGSGNYPDSFCCNKSDWWKTNNCDNFENIWKAITGDPTGAGTYGGYTMGTVPVSAAGLYCPPGDQCIEHCGGAMGPAQAMSYTWKGLEDTVIRLTGHSAVSPWNYDDACVFAGVHLSTRGSANTQLCIDEAEAVYRYVGGHREHAYNIVEAANLVADQIGENRCLSSATPPTAPLPPGNAWLLPIRPHTVLSSNAQDHLRRESYLAWDLTAPYGYNVLPVASGTVTNADCGITCPTCGCRVMIDHGGGYVSSYSHLISASMVSRGQSVDVNTVIGQVGCTGKTSFGPHTHFQILYNGTLIDPATIYGTGGIAYRPFCKNLACYGGVYNPDNDPTLDPCFQ